MVGATTCRRGLELISAHDKLAKVLYTVRVLFKHIEHKARYSYKGISPSEASWWPYLTIYDQNRFRMSIIPRIPDFTNVHFFSRNDREVNGGGHQQMAALSMKELFNLLDSDKSGTLSRAEVSFVHW